MGILAQITLFNVGFHMSGMNQWNGSRKQGKQQKHVGQSATSRRKRHGQPRGTERQMMCDQGPLIDRHLTPEGKEHGQPRQANHRISQKNTEKTQKFMILGFLERIHHFLHTSAFLRPKKI